MSLVSLVPLVAPACVGLLVATPVQAQRADRFAHAFVSEPVEGPRNPAVEKRYTAQFKLCQDKAVSTRAIEACFAAEFARQDKELNRIWRMTLPRFEGSSRAQLLAAQRTWAARRDPFCRSEADGFSGGTIAPVAYVELPRRTDHQAHDVARGTALGFSTPHRHRHTVTPSHRTPSPVEPGSACLRPEEGGSRVKPGMTARPICPRASLARPRPWAWRSWPAWPSPPAP